MRNTISTHIPVYTREGIIWAKSVFLLYVFNTSVRILYLHAVKLGGQITYNQCTVLVTEFCLFPLLFFAKSRCFWFPAQFIYTFNQLIKFQNSFLFQQFYWVLYNSRDRILSMYSPIVSFTCSGSSFIPRCTHREKYNCRLIFLIKYQTISK